MNLPLVTFIIAHHNYEQYLESCIKSAQLQTYQNINICVVDDCSKNQDNVKTIVKTTLFDNNKPTVNMYENNMDIYRGEKACAIFLEGGPYRQAYARNRGIENMWDETDIFAILDADDCAHPTKIEKMVQLMMVDKNVGVVYADYDTINVETELKCREFKEPYDAIRLQQECIVHSGSIIKKEALETVLENGVVFDENLPPIEDYDLWLRLSRKWMFLHIPESLTLVRVHPQNSTNTTTHEFRMQQFEKMRKKYASYSSS